MKPMLVHMEVVDLVLLAVLPFQTGTLSLELTNNWPVPVSMGVDLVNTATGSTIVSYSLSNASANGGTATDTESLVNKTLPNSVGFKITSLTSPGSGTSL